MQDKTINSQRTLHTSPSQASYGVPFVSIWRKIFVLQRGLTAGALCNIGYPSEIHLKLKSREILYAHNSCLSWPIILKFCTEHGSITAVLCANFQTDWTIETDVMDQPVFLRFEFKMSLKRISCIEQHPRAVSPPLPMSLCGSSLARAARAAWPASPLCSMLSTLCDSARFHRNLMRADARYNVCR